MGTIRVQSASAKNDGSGIITFDVYGIDSGSAVVPGRHTTVEIPSTEAYSAVANKSVAWALAGADVAERNTRLHQLVLEQVNGEWTSAALDLVSAANTDADDETTNLDGHWVDSGGLPVDLAEIV